MFILFVIQLVICSVIDVCFLLCFCVSQLKNLPTLYMLS